MTFRQCRCEVPRESTDPRRAGWCNVCCGRVPVMGDDWMRDFYRQVREMLETTGHDDVGEPLSVQALRRHDAGKEIFRQRWASRVNADEGTEEAADGSNYAAYDAARGRRLIKLGADESDVDAAQIHFLEAAYFFALAHAALRAGRDALRDAMA